MAWLETDRHGRLRIAFKYFDGRTYREPLGVEATKRTRVDAERLSSTIQLELSAGSFDYAKRFPNSERIKKLGLKRPEQRSNQTLKEFAEAAWLPEKRLEVKRSTFVYYNEIYKPHIEKAEIGKKLLSEINDEDINLWKLEIEGKRTPQKKPLSTRRKNMSLDVLCQILRLAKRRGLANDKLLIDARPFKNEENEDEVNPFTEDEVESLLKASEGWERSLLSVCFFTGMRRGEVLGLRWSGVFFDRDRILVRRSLTRHGESSPKSKTSFRYVQMLPRVREELLKQRDRVKLRSEFVFPNQGVEGIERELGDEGVVATVGREGRGSVSATHANAAYIRDPHAAEGSPNRLAPEADGPSKPHHADPSLLALDQSGRAEPGDVGPIGSRQEFIESTPT